MKPLALVLLLLCAACAGDRAGPEAPARQGVSRDALAVLDLDGALYGPAGYRLVHARASESARQTLLLLKDDEEVEAVELPLPDDEVKNFSLSGIEETAEGFLLTMEWGGGNYFYTRTFDFEYADGAFFLKRVRSHDVDHRDGEQARRDEEIEPPVPLGAFEPIDFLLGPRG